MLLLSKTKIDKITFCQDNEEFIRKVRLMEYHQCSDKHPTKETPFMKPQSSNWTPPSGRNIYVDSFVDTARKQCNNALINDLPTQISNINKSDNHSLNELAKDIKKLTKVVLLCTSTHVITSTVVRIFCQIQPITKTYNQKHLRSS